MVGFMQLTIRLLKDGKVWFNLSKPYWSLAPFMSADKQAATLNAGDNIGSLSDSPTRC